MKGKLLLIIVALIAVLCFVVFGIPAIHDANIANEQAKLQAEIERAKYTPKSPSTTEENCKIVQKLLEYEKLNYADRENALKEEYGDNYDYDKWRNYKEKTLQNFGMYYGGIGTLRSFGKYYGEEFIWKNVWVIDEAFIRKYVSMYSTDGFFEMYRSYIQPLLVTNVRSDYQEDAIHKYISDTAKLLLSMTDLFDVYEFHPVMDRFTKTASEEVPVSGTFNVGRDNHVETRTSSYTKDTYIYKENGEYRIIHEHGDKYDSGEYGYKNGVFVDIPSSFKKFSTYTLYKDGKLIIDAASSVEGLECTFIDIGNDTYIKVTVTGDRSRRYNEPYHFLVRNYDYRNGKDFADKLFTTSFQ